MSGPVVIAAGGTGGHVFPALALAAALRADGIETAFITDRRGSAFEGEIAGVACYAVRAGAVAERNVLGILRSLTNLLIGTWQARGLLRRLKPPLAVGFGGYASVPPLFAAAGLGVPTLIHEANAVLGRANRLLAHRARVIATAFPKTTRVRPGQRLAPTGNPVRAEIVAARAVPYAAPKPDGPFRLLVIGGSQGARIMGSRLPQALATLPDATRSRLALTLQCREEDLSDARANLDAAGIKAEVYTFYHDIADRLASAHLVIARAGASTVAELTCIGRPAILIPFAHATDDHQSANAAALVAAGGAWVIAESDIRGEALRDAIAARMTDPTLANAAAKAQAFGTPDAAARLATLAKDLMQEGAR
ncbi:MAG: undecaprenyldiphospho-muramoylpentapeptide beta-N-acetylglucosaminyltransferase [Alphaproteobacteria bacterium]|jgi:UDP-N-acetylglucosamine--N-acetylmuramyl-(pentapeptide) pyrophosphoryl-undecaprenol N-acetylglucosamine transferase|nr:undecaprenyldiphospho-muramoylpentapeptide beta-N-acetylglucosaminyltransferase [Alphaproteobacteria bacterium]